MTKLILTEDRITVSAETARATVLAALINAGFDPATASTVTDHLIESSLCGVESHGIMRCLQYIEQLDSGYLKPNAAPAIEHTAQGGTIINGHGGIGIPAMITATDHCIKAAKSQGIAAAAVRNVGHTGRLGAFGQSAANQGYLAIIIGGGGRENWRQVAPYGGRKAILPTNPYCLAMPGGDHGPIILDFATSIIAGGWIYAAHNAGAKLPEGAIIDAAGEPSTDPQAYFDGGAILPMGGAKGYALALIAEMIAEAMLGPSTTECHWLIITLNCSQFRDTPAMQQAAEEVLTEIRNCPPAQGFNSVEIPGERERNFRTHHLTHGLQIPAKTWLDILNQAQP